MSRLVRFIRRTPECVRLAVVAAIVTPLYILGVVETLRTIVRGEPQPPPEEPEHDV